MTPEDIQVGEWQPALADAPQPPARIPHFGHALLLLAIAGMLLLVTQAVTVLPVAHSGASITDIAQQHPKLLLAAEAVTYLLTLTLSWFIFPLLWHRSFLTGIRWNAVTARRLFPKLVPLGLITGWTIQAISSLISMPKTVPMDDFFRSTSDVWLVTLFGTLVAPLFEEITFRGFLLPAFTIAFDWLPALLRFPRNPAPPSLYTEAPISLFPEDRTPLPIPLTDQADNLTHRSLPALIVASLLTSALFGLLHAQQLGYTWPAVLLLSGVSLILTTVRIRTRSLACSTLVHASYNLSVFLILFVGTGGYRHLDRMTR